MLFESNKAYDLYKFSLNQTSRFFFNLKLFIWMKDIFVIQDNGSKGYLESKTCLKLLHL